MSGRNSAIPKPEVIRAMPADSVRNFCDALENAGLTISHGSSHLRVTTARGALLGTVPYTPSDHRSLLNTRARMAKRAGEMRASNAVRKRPVAQPGASDNPPKPV